MEQEQFLVREVYRSSHLWEVVGTVQTDSKIGVCSKLQVCSGENGSCQADLFSDSRYKNLILSI